MDELQTILALKSQVQDDIRKLQDKLRALEVVEKMIRDSKQPGAIVPVAPKTYSDMKQDDAIRHALKAAGRKLTATEIADALRRGGFKFESANPSNSIFATMKKNAKRLYASEKFGKRTVFGLAEESQKAEAGNAA
ncbi:MAG: hypothetical protein ACRD2L_02600 [Terriglobia bacterium]